jgi:threonine synthase
MRRNGLQLDGKRVVCVITGTGLKDPDLAVSSAQAHTVDVQPNLEAIESAIMESFPVRQ